MSLPDRLLAVVRDNRQGLRRALPSWCTAHQETLAAILAAHRDNDDPILVEATCNQVNQEGGYTGLTPQAFRAFVEGLAKTEGIDIRRLIFGGDHLGPNPWRHLTSREAMRRAGEMVRAYVEAGYIKIHLDASMRCADDVVLEESEIAARAANLCAIAEQASSKSHLVYVVGTEVPIPGGETTPLAAHAITPAANVDRTIDLHAKAFASRGLGDVMGRAVAIVVQPGVDFNNNEILHFDKTAAASLVQALAEHPTIAFEGHSTDFQSGAALGDLVDCNFAFLKVGPELTFAFREAIFAMASADNVFAGLGDSAVVRALEEVMDADPSQWRPYVAEDGNARIDRLFGLSDRVRYYWGIQSVRTAVGAQMARIDSKVIPPGVFQQFVGALEGDKVSTALSKRVIEVKVQEVVRRYRNAAGYFDR
jgi:D-tagatose-bisphosphate aldolase class II non-catalytic subunit